jgi:hypothetical protein
MTISGAQSIRQMGHVPGAIFDAGALAGSFIGRQLFGLEPPVAVAVMGGEAP